MKRTLYLLAAVSAATLSIATSALADPPRALTIGQTTPGTLTPSDAKAEDNSLYDDYTVRLTAGQGIEVLMSSSAFDTFLHVGKGTGTAFEQLKTDDDGGGGTDAQLRFAAPTDGVYTIRANALNESMSGAYSLRLSAYTPPPAAVSKPLAYGPAVSGTLADGGARLEDGDKLYDQYTFTASAGERVKIETASKDFDSVLELGRMVDGSFETVKEDDDGAGEKNARVLAILETAGEYVVRVIGFDKDAKGAYTVGLTRLPPPAAAPRPKTIRTGQVVRAELTAGSAEYDEFRAYDYYQLSGRAGDEVTLIMRSEMFDTYLDVGVLSPGGFAVLKSDDDGGGDTNSKIDFKFDRSGTVIIRVSPLHGGSIGWYSLSAE